MNEAILIAMQRGRVAKRRSGQVLRDLRLRRGMRQVDVAQVLGVTQGFISEMEREGIGKVENLFAVAAAFSVDPAEIIAGATAGNEQQLII